ncbi:hypothetical protein [Bacillus glycinifermentans]|uniref:hypothetical protein n=1 Tax=Bacillus glycinifermentans TaxID=1664069 RepID=UPI001582CDFF|nr:hypothetical protein [Bacillus glycinifermentans]
MSQLNKIKFIPKDVNESDITKALAFCRQLLWDDMRLNGVLDELSDEIKNT